MERLQKILARAGVASRRASEDLIRAGRVTVNGQPASLGQQADPDRDVIRVDGRRLPAAPETVWIVLNKPRGVVVSDRPQGRRRTARELVAHPGRLFAVGRLDVDSEGVVVLTNDGDLAERLSHPRYEHEKEYRVLLDRAPDAAQLATWARGVVLADGFRTRPVRVRRQGRWLGLVLREGHKRQIRESARSLGLSVERLIRLRVGPFRLDGLKPGEWRTATAAEIRGIATAAGGEAVGRSRHPRSRSVSGRAKERR